MIGPPAIEVGEPADPGKNDPEDPQQCCGDKLDMYVDRESGTREALNQKVYEQSYYNTIATGLEVTSYAVGVGEAIGLARLGWSMGRLAFTRWGASGFRLGLGGGKRFSLNMADNARAATGSDIALGLGDDLFTFAEHHGFQTYRDFSTGFQPDKILSVINNSSNNLHFNLTGFSRVQFSKFNPANPVGYRNITNWELHNILSNPSALQRTTFYKFSNGGYQIIPNPF